MQGIYNSVYEICISFYTYLYIYKYSILYVFVWYVHIKSDSIIKTAVKSAHDG